MVEKKEDKDFEGEVSNKIKIQLQPVGNAPIITTLVFQLSAFKTVGFVSKWISSKIKLPAGDTIFLYVKSSFAPPQDVILRDLYESFGNKDNNTLVLSYAIQEAWG